MWFRGKFSQIWEQKKDTDETIASYRSQQEEYASQIQDYQDQIDELTEILEDELERIGEMEIEVSCSWNQVYPIVQGRFVQWAAGTAGTYDTTYTLKCTVPAIPGDRWLSGNFVSAYQLNEYSDECMSPLRQYPYPFSEDVDGMCVCPVKATLISDDVETNYAMIPKFSGSFN